MANRPGSTGAADVYIPSPPDDFRLNVFLVHLAEELKGDEFDALKNILSGPGGFRRKVLEEMTSARDLFTHMKNAQMISKENIVVLQALVWHIGRPDLYADMVKLAGELDGALHTVCPMGQPENGFKYVRFHIQGGKCPDKAKLEVLRDRVSYWMCVPREFVTVHGIEPSGSWVITFMVPEICVGVLLERAKTHSHWFTSMDIDRFEVVGGDVIILDEPTMWQSERDGDPLDKENRRLREKVEHLELLKERLEISNIKQSRDKEATLASCNRIRDSTYQMMRFYEEQHNFFFGLLLMALGYLHLFKKSFLEGTSLGLRNGAVTKLESAMVAYKRNMEEIRRKSYDVDLIGKLLESFRVIALTRYLEELRLTQFILSDNARNDTIAAHLRNVDLEVENSMLRLKLTELSLKWEGHEPVEDKPTGSPPKNGSSTENTFPEFTLGIQIGFRQDFLQLLREVSNHLQKTERNRILKTHKDISFTVQEKSLYSKVSDKDKLLEVILIKHIQAISERSREVHEHPENIIKALLVEVGRQDLIIKLDDYGKKSKEMREAILKQAKESPFQLHVQTQIVQRVERINTMTF